jgi:hypothetical protein
MIKTEGGKMMYEYTTLSAYLEALVDKKEALDNVDIEAIVEEKISETRAEIRAKVLAEVEDSKHDVEVSIDTLTKAIAIVARVADSRAEEVSEVITDETY